MTITLPLITSIYTSGVTLYAVLIDADSGKFWNGSAFENYNAAHWSTYAVALTEFTSSGIYSATRPAGVAGFLTIEAVYLQAGGTPATGDAPPTILGHSHGDNVAAISGDALSAPTNLQAALGSEEQGTIASGTITTTSFPTSLTDSTAGVYSGRVLVMTSGAAIRQVSLIANYSPTSGTLNLAGGLAIAPSIGDAFIII